MAEIQLDMLAAVEPSRDLHLTRTQRMTTVNGVRPVEITLARIQVEPHAGQWMWAISINSTNGSGRSYAPLPKWGKFAATHADAVGHAADEIRSELDCIAPNERARVIAWLGEVLSCRAQAA